MATKRSGASQAPSAPKGHRRSRPVEAYVYTPELEARAVAFLEAAKARGWRIATAESCTGGALAAILTDVEGLSHVFDRGFAVYTDAAKRDTLGVDARLLETHGAVSDAVARAMAIRALECSEADLSASITGFAGDAGPDDEPGLVYVAVARRDGGCVCRSWRFGRRGRAQVRILALFEALRLLCTAVGGEGSHAPAWPVPGTP